MHAPSTARRSRGGLVALIFAIVTAFSIMACGGSSSSGAPGATFDNGGGGGGTLETDNGAGGTLGTDSVAEPTVAQ